MLAVTFWIRESAKAERGSELTAMTGRRQRETHVACAKKAMKNLEGEPRIFSKRESFPSSEDMRLKR
jgi:hypothetical protein